MRMTLIAATATLFMFAQPALADLEFATMTSGAVELTVEVAATQQSRERGLMDRKRLADGTGMLFVYPKKREARLWMKNTHVPLSAAFLDDDGRVLEIIRMEKPDSTRIYRSKEKVRYALEVPLGWFESSGIKVGDLFTLPRDTTPE